MSNLIDLKKCCTRFNENTKKEYFNIEYKLLTNKIIIKGKVIKASKGFDSFDETNFKMHFNYFSTKVEEIIIGDNVIKPNDKINIYYASSWCSNDNISYCPLDRIKIFSF